MKRFARRWWWGFGVGLACLVVTGCGSKPAPRTIADIERDLRTLPHLYITASGKEIMAPWTDAQFVRDPDSGELAWLARYCRNPSCPNQGKGTDGRPYLFIWTDPTLIIPADGSLPTDRQEPGLNESREDFVKRLGGQVEPTCPGCLPSRNLAKETPKERTRYSDWITEFVPPAAIKRKEELEAEKKAWQASLTDRRMKKAKPDENQ